MPVNAGDGAHEHPTQGLLDTFTMKEHLGSLKGRKVVILGDILFSRVARSNIWALLKLGAHVTLCGPSTLVPRVFEQMGCRVTHNVDEAIAGADVINLLRIQHERQRKTMFPSIGEYAALFGLNRMPKDVFPPLNVPTARALRGQAASLPAVVTSASTARPADTASETGVSRLNDPRKRPKGVRFAATIRIRCSIANNRRWIVVFPTKNTGCERKMQTQDRQHAHPSKVPDRPLNRPPVDWSTPGLITRHCPCRSFPSVPAIP